MCVKGGKHIIDKSPYTCTFLLVNFINVLIYYNVVIYILNHSTTATSKALSKDGAVRTAGGSITLRFLPLPLIFVTKDDLCSIVFSAKAILCL